MFYSPKIESDRFSLIDFDIFLLLSVVKTIKLKKGRTPIPFLSPQIPISIDSDDKNKQTESKFLVVRSAFQSSYQPKVTSMIESCIFLFFSSSPSSSILLDLLPSVRPHFFSSYSNVVLATSTIRIISHRYRSFSFSSTQLHLFRSRFFFFLSFLLIEH